MSDKIKLGVNGAAGRMGQRIVALAHADPELTVAAALEWKSSPQQGRDAGEVAGVGPIGVHIAAELRGPVDVIIDFSTPEGLIAIAELCAQRQIPLVGATTGLNDEQRQAVMAASQMTPLILAPNMSLAVNLTMKLVREAAKSSERIRPASTSKSSNGTIDSKTTPQRHRPGFRENCRRGNGTDRPRSRAAGLPGKRPQNEIGYHAIRVGDNVGEHTIVFGLIGETIDLHVRGQSRDSYAYGALAAAKFLVTKNAGFYTMADVLGLALIPQLAKSLKPSSSLRVDGRFTKWSLTSSKDSSCRGKSHPQEAAGICGPR